MTGDTDLPEPARVQSLARGLFPSAVVVRTMSVSDSVPAAMPEETACLSPRTVAGRRREFAAGRAAARAAMAELGLEPAAITMSADRSPIWPPGLTGTIAHCGQFALAALVRSRDIRAIGIDVEPSDPLAADLVSEICSPAELAWLDTLADPLTHAKLVFCAKEAAYKSQYPISRTMFGFDGLDTQFDMENNSFTARFTRDVGPFSAGARIKGRFAVGAGVILTGATLPSRGGSR